MRKLIAAALLVAGCAANAQESAPMPAPPPQVATDHAALLASPDPRLAANKRLVYDMYRIVLQAGLADRAAEFISEGYVQHNPNAGQGLGGVQDYIRKTAAVLREGRDGYGIAPAKFGARQLPSPQVNCRDESLMCGMRP
jgi:hypothetical protein